MKPREWLPLMAAIVVVVAVWALVIYRGPSHSPQSRLPSTGPRVITVTVTVTATAPASTSSAAAPPSGTAGSSGGANSTALGAGSSQATAASRQTASGVDQEDVQEGDREDEGATTASTSNPLGGVTSVLPRVKVSPTPLPSLP